MFGAGQPMADVRRAMVEGAAGPFGPDAAIYGLDRPLDPGEQAAREALQAEAHCDALPAELLPGMVEAQRFRDAGLADAALWALTMTGGGQVVVIAGNGHADLPRGMPAAIASPNPRSGWPRSASSRQPPAEGEAPPTTRCWSARRPARDDPCGQLTE